MDSYSVKDILCNIIAQTSEYNKNIEVHGTRLSELINIIEYLVNQTSKLKTVVLDMPKNELEVN